MKRPQTKKDFVFFLLILGGIIAIGPLTIDIYLPAFSAIAKDFNAGDHQVQLSMASYFLGITLGQISYGPIIDRFGKKPPLFFGLTLFVIASIGCYFCTSIDQLIVLRFFQAFGACAGTIIPRAIVRDIFSPQETARVFSHLIMVIGLAPILAPLIGSLLLEWFGWRAIFAFLGFFAVCCLIVVYVAIPETHGPNKDEKISKALRKYYRILGDRDFRFSALIGGFMIAGLFAYITGSPAIYLGNFHLSTRHFGMIFSANAIGFMIASQINARLLKHFLIAQMMSKITYLPLVIGLLMLICPHNFWLITLLFFCYLCSCGMLFPNASALALSNHVKHSGSAAALLGAIQFAMASMSSFLVSRIHDGSPKMVLLVVGGCGVAACVTYKIYKREAPAGF